MFPTGTSWEVKVILLQGSPPELLASEHPFNSLIHSTSTQELCMIREAVTGSVKAGPWVQQPQTSETGHMTEDNQASRVAILQKV